MAVATPTERAFARENYLDVTQQQRARDAQQAASISESRPPSFGVGQMDGLSGARQARDAAADNTNPAQNARSITGALRTAREKQRQLLGSFETPTAAVVSLVNKSYETWFNTFQSGLIAPIFTLIGVFVTGPIFIVLYFLRIIVGLFKMKMKEVYVLPPYRFTSAGGIIVALTHTGVVALILLFYLLLAFLIIFVVYLMTLPTWEQFLILFGDGFSGLKSIYDALH